MITDLILQIFYGFSYSISLVVSSFGEVNDNNAITTSITILKTYYMSLNEYLPIDTILAIIAFDLAFEGSVFIYKLVRWGYKKVPSIS
jgi:hypothetical protein